MSGSLLEKLKEEVQKFGGVVVSGSKYWLTFKVKDSGSFAAINASTKSVRVFISCDPGRINDPQRVTRPSPSSGAWKKKYPLVFKVSSESELGYAVDLIRQSYQFVLEKRG
jgi:predicted transport protein